MELTRTDQGEQTTLTLAGILKMDTAPSLQQLVSELEAAQRKNVIVDMSAVSEVDSSGVAAMVSLHKAVKRMDGTLRIVGLRDQPRAIFKLLRMDKVFSY